MRRLINRSQFLHAARGAKWVTPGFVLQANQSPDATDSGLGFTASRRVGGAVVRNRAKRRLREIARLNLRPHARSACDYVLIARTGTDTVPFHKLLDDLDHAVHMVHKRLDNGATGSPNGPRRGRAPNRPPSRSEQRTPDTR